jgi:hypothetical protein
MSKSTPLSKAHPVLPNAQPTVQQPLQQPSLLNAGVSLYQQLQKNIQVSAPNSTSPHQVHRMEKMMEHDTFPTEHLAYVIPRSASSQQEPLPRQQQQQQQQQRQRQNQLPQLSQQSRRRRSNDLQAGDSKRQQQDVLKKMRRDLSRFMDTLYDDIHSRNTVPIQQKSNTYKSDINQNEENNYTANDDFSDNINNNKQTRSFADAAAAEPVAASTIPTTLFASSTNNNVADDTAMITSATVNALDLKIAELSSQVASLNTLIIIIVVGVAILLAGSLIYLCVAACRKR